MPARVCPNAGSIYAEADLMSESLVSQEKDRLQPEPSSPSPRSPMSRCATRYGRQVYAVGGNPEAARLSGLNVNRIIASVYLISGFFCGLGSFVLAARLNSAEAVAGTGYELTVIASVVIGGTSLFGGSGTIFGTVVGTILIGVLLNGLVLMNVSSYIQQIIIGVIIVLAVAFDTFAKSRRRKA